MLIIDSILDAISNIHGFNAMINTTISLIIKLRVKLIGTLVDIVLDKYPNYVHT
jgi:hypothetical protein